MKGKPCQHKHPLQGCPRELRAFGRTLERAGLRLERTKHNHVVVIAPGGKHVGTFGINKVSRHLIKLTRRNIERQLGRALPA